VTEILNAIPGALAEVFQLSNLGFLVFGVVVGLAVGAVPGIGGFSAMALLLPFSFTMEAQAAIGMMLGIAAASTISDTAPAILFGVPGSAAAQATVLDGHALARKGEAARALGASYSAAMLGGLVGAGFLLLAIPVARVLVKAFGSPELFALGLIGVAMTGSLSGNAPLKGLAAGGLGLLLGMIGFDQVTGSLRWTFDSLYLYDGLPLVVVALGLFGIPELLQLMHGGESISGGDEPTVGSILEGIKDTIRNWFLVIRTSAIGIFTGTVPGLGGAVVDWFAYGHALQTEKGAHETFGKGDIRGVIGVDAAANAKDGGGLLPTLFFGVPGSTVTALLLTVFLVHGIQPGPALATTGVELTLAIVFSLVLANLLGGSIMLLLGKSIAKISIVPIHIVSPIVIALIVFASVQATSNPRDLLVLGLFGLVGAMMKDTGWPRPPLLVGFILSPILERYYFISTQRYGYSWLGRPWVIVSLSVSIFVVVGAIRQLRKVKRQSAEVVE